MQPIKAVIFDLDGVLVTTDSLHYEAWKSIADDEGIYFDREINHRLRGVSRMQSLDIILERASRSYVDSEKQALAERKNARYVQLLERLSPDNVPAEVRHVLASLKRRGVKIAVGSSSRNTSLILSRTRLAGQFDAVADGNDIQRTKPEPDVFLVAQRRLGVPCEQCLVVEDAVAGIAAAKAAGMQAAAIGDATRSEMADYKLTAITDLLELVIGDDGSAEEPRVDGSRKGRDAK